MSTLDDEGPEMRPEYDFSQAKQATGPRFPEGFGIAIDGATGYSVRLIPSNKVVGRAEATEDLWSVVLDAIDSGIPARCIVLDAHLEDGTRYKIGAGRLLEVTARAGIGSAARAERSRVAS
jgi:hypothetical protein